MSEKKKRKVGTVRTSLRSLMKRDGCGETFDKIYLTSPLGRYSPGERVMRCRYRETLTVILPLGADCNLLYWDTITSVCEPVGNASIILGVTDCIPLVPDGVIVSIRDREAVKTILDISKLTDIGYKLDDFPNLVSIAAYSKCPPNHHEIIQDASYKLRYVTRADFSNVEKVTISPYTFEGTYISDVSFPNGDKCHVDIGDYAFRATKLKQLVITCTCYLGTRSFAETRHLNTVSITNIKRIKDRVFSNSAVCRINCNNYGISMFSNCRRLTSVTVSGHRIPSKCFCASGVKAVTLDNCLSVGEEAFSHCDNLTDVRFSGEKILLASRAFAGSKNLENLHSDGTLVSLQSDPFEGCDKLILNNISVFTPNTHSFTEKQFRMNVPYRRGSSIYTSYPANELELESPMTLNDLLFETKPGKTIAYTPKFLTFKCDSGYAHVYHAEVSGTVGAVCPLHVGSDDCLVCNLGVDMDMKVFDFAHTRYQRTCKKHTLEFLPGNLYTMKKVMTRQGVMIYKKVTPGEKRLQLSELYHYNRCKREMDDNPSSNVCYDFKYAETLNDKYGANLMALILRLTPSVTSASLT